MEHKEYQEGNTVMIKAQFYDFDGRLVDPDFVNVTIYSHATREILFEDDALKESVGVYYYYFTVPSAKYGPVVYEFFGEWLGVPSVNRDTIFIKWG